MTCSGLAGRWSTSLNIRIRGLISMCGSVQKAHCPRLQSHNYGIEEGFTGLILVSYVKGKIVILDYKILT